MNRTRIGAITLLFLLLASPLAALPARELRGQVFHLGENGEKVSEPGLIVTLVETGATDDTNDQGIFRLPLPPAFQPGDPITISVDKTGWRIRYPLDGGARIPRDLPREIVPVELLQVGSKLFWTNDRIEKFIRDASERAKQEVRLQEGRQRDNAPTLDLGRDIKDWAAKYGFSAQEAQKEIDRWIAEVEAAHEDSYQKGLAAFAKQQFDVAVERFRDSAEWRIRQLAETRKQQETLAKEAEKLLEEVVRDLRLEGDAHFHADRFQQALAVYEQAHQYTTKDQTPQLWAATLNDIGLVHWELAVYEQAAESPAHFAAALQAFQQALLVYTREQTPQDWARTQNLLGNSLAEQGKRTAGKEGAQLLACAVQAYRQALLIETREKMPQHWAWLQDNLGVTLIYQGARTAGEEGAQLIAQAVQACRQALLVMTRENMPQDWAVAQYNLGIALTHQGDHMAGEESAQLLAQAVQAFRQSLLVFTQEKMPKLWASTQDGLGNALADQGERMAGEEGAQLLAQAAQAYRQALLVATREHLPQNWATIQNNLGVVLTDQGKRISGEAGAQLLTQGGEAFRQALLVRTRDSMPLDWAMTQGNLGESLQEQGKYMAGEARVQLLAQAIEAYRQALLVVSPKDFSEFWKETRIHEAEVLLALHRYDEAAETLYQVLNKFPDHQPAFELLGMALNNQLFDHQAAVELTRSWLSRHPDDLHARLALGEQLFASKIFSDCNGEISSLLEDLKLSAGDRVVALGYAIAANLAIDSADVSNRIEELLGVVEAQPQSFSVSWMFDGTLHSLGEALQISHRDLLVRLFQALQAPDRDSMLQGLRDVKKAILAEGRLAS